MTLERLQRRVALAVAALLTSSAALADEKTDCSEAANQAGPMRSEGKLKEAREKLIRCAQASCPKVVRDDCQNDLRAVDAELPSVVVRASDPAGRDLTNARVEGRGEVLASSLDGNAIPLNPGPITLHVTAEGRTPKDVELVIARGEKSRVVKLVLEAPGAKPSWGYDTPPPDPPSKASSSTAPYVFLGVGGASLIAFGVLEAVAQSEYSTLKSGCGATKSCEEAAVAPTRAKFIGAGVALGVGAASTLVGLGWILFASKRGAPRAALRVSPNAVTLDGAF